MRVIFSKRPDVNHCPIGEKSANLVTLIPMHASSRTKDALTQKENEEQSST
jgi:hypothetical protein